MTSDFTIGDATRYRAIIEGNTIINTKCGIDATVREDIRNNVIAYNEVGISGGSLIEGNLIINNICGVNGGKEIRKNTIVNNFVRVEGGSLHSFTTTSTTTLNITSASLRQKPQPPQITDGEQLMFQRLTKQSMTTKTTSNYPKST